MRPPVVAMAAAVLFAAAPACAAPPGAVALCLTEASYCVKDGEDSAPLADAALVLRINRDVNYRIFADPPLTADERRSDNRHWHAAMPGALGTCVTYALTKQFLLAWAGVPTRAMRLPEVSVPGNPDPSETHLVLIVRIGGTDFVLDSLTSVVWPLDTVKERYAFKAIQSPDDGANWEYP